MNPYQFEVTCSTCGGPGVADIRGAAAEWFGGVVHSDPRVCQEYLAERERKLAKREKDLEDKS